MRSLLFAFLLASWAPSALAAATEPPVRAEIDALMDRLQSSGCRFNRNGSWYTGAEARKHLVGKLEYLERRGTVPSTEQFIELAAAKSSSSGKPYLVQCGSGAAVESRAWLSAELKGMRAAGKDTAGGKK